MPPHLHPDVSQQLDAPHTMSAAAPVSQRNVQTPAPQSTNAPMQDPGLQSISQSPIVLHESVTPVHAAAPMHCSETDREASAARVMPEHELEPTQITRHGQFAGQRSEAKEHRDGPRQSTSHTPPAQDVHSVGQVPAPAVPSAKEHVLSVSDLWVEVSNAASTEASSSSDGENASS